MTLPGKSYIEELKTARELYDDYLPDHKRQEQETRASWQEYARHWGVMAELAVRALGQGAEPEEVAALFPNFNEDAGKLDLSTYRDIEQFTKQLERGIRDWLFNRHPEALR